MTEGPSQGQKSLYSDSYHELTNFRIRNKEVDVNF